jgi:hypothetical protein
MEKRVLLMMYDIRNMDKMWGERGMKAAVKKEYQERGGDRRTGEREAWVKVNMLSAFL